MTSLAIDGRGLRKSFGSGELTFEALKGIDLEVNEGELVMLAGPSGSGKTTLLSILGGVLRPTAGELLLFGARISGLDERELSRVRKALIGFIFQGVNLIAALSARENVALPLELQKVARSRALAAADELLEQVGLAEKLANKPEALSGGEMQRVGIARALATDPPLVLADEPTAALDATNGLRITELLRDLARGRGTTVVVVTHDARIFHLADRILHIEDGRLIDAEAHA